jgi:hypothetical protein
MAQVAIFDEAPKAWIDFDDDTEVLIEYLDRPDAIALHKEVDKLTARTGGDRQIIWGRELGKKVVHGWRHKDQKKNPDHPGLVLPGGAPLPFNEANRDLMMKKCREFSAFVNESAIDGKIFLELSENEGAVKEAKKP